MPEADAQRADAVNLGGVHVELGLKGLGLAQDHAVDAGGHEDAKDSHDERDVGADGADDGEDDDRGRQGHHDFRAPADNALSPDGGGCGQGQDGAEPDAYQYRDEGCAQGAGGGSEDAAEDVPAQFVRAQPVGGGGPGEDGREVLVLRLERQPPGGGQGGNHQGGQPDHAGNAAG
ncbi:hypothetical protein D9M72_500090 [compost metagenome]